jgi:hypothetical protein
VRSVAVLVLCTLLVPASASRAHSTEAAPAAPRSLDGSGNNLSHPDWGRAGTPYLRVAPPRYADGIGAMAGGPPPRYVSNRIFNDVGQNLFSENDLSQWAWLWGQFLDHDFGLRDERSAEGAPIAFAAADPLEAFRNDLGTIDFARTPAAPGTGVTSPRQQVNTISSYIDGSGVYGVDPSRLAWLRKGARLVLPHDYLPLATARGNSASAPPMDLMGPLVASPRRAVVAGDVRANENIALTAVHTLFAREHNRIVAALPARMPAQAKFELARRVVGAEIQYVTYTQFLPSVGVRLASYRGYDPAADASLSNEFAAVGYRAHSMIHGELEPVARAGRYAAAQLAAFRRQGIGIEREGKDVRLVIPLGVAFGNPSLLPSVGLGPLLAGLADERQYRNDEQIDNSLRSVLFQVPRPGVADPGKCGAPVVDPACFTGVLDLGALDIQRARDHGIPRYNELRLAYGLSPRRSFAAITGERTERFPPDRLIDARDPIDDPSILDFVEVRDGEGHVLDPKSDEAQEEAVTGVRRTTLAARLRAVYRDVDRLDAFVGMVSEAHVPGSDLGPLQLAIWKRQFAAVRDGDRFFYAHDPELARIKRVYGIDFRHTLGELIRVNTGAPAKANVFRRPTA